MSKHQQKQGRMEPKEIADRIDILAEEAGNEEVRREYEAAAKCVRRGMNQERYPGYNSWRAPE